MYCTRPLTSACCRWRCARLGVGCIPVVLVVRMFLDFEEVTGSGNVARHSWSTLSHIYHATLGINTLYFQLQNNFNSCNHHHLLVTDLPVCSLELMEVRGKFYPSSVLESECN
jgi:hypothetical protein